MCRLTVLGLILLGSVPRVGAVRPPAEVELEGDFEILREPEDACQLAVPTTITGTVTLTIDFVEGTAEGRIEGTGKGEQGIPPSCTGRDGTDVYHAETTFSGIISRDADDVLSGTDLVGWVDGITGEFLVHAIIEIEGAGYHGIPGKLYQCAGSDFTERECLLGEIVTPQPAFITGRVLTGGIPEIHVDWYTNFCAKVTKEAIKWGRDSCPTGTRANPGVVSFVPAVNAAPVIEALRVAPLNPFTATQWT